MAKCLAGTRAELRAQSYEEQRFGEAWGELPTADNGSSPKRERFVGMPISPAVLTPQGEVRITDSEVWWRCSSIRFSRSFD